MDVENNSPEVEQAIQEVGVTRENLSVDWYPIEVIKKNLGVLNDLKDVILVVDTRDFHGIVIQRSIGDPLPKKFRTTPDTPSEFLTLEQAVNRVEEWKNKGFRWTSPHKAKSGNDEVVNFNIGFKYIRVYWHPKGYLWCDTYNTSMSSELLENFVYFPKEKAKCPEHSTIDTKGSVGLNTSPIIVKK